jgi:methionine sulfoxide reductase heme-binding subunit
VKKNRILFPLFCPDHPEMTAIDLSGDAALTALALTTANICLGLLIASRYSPVRNWPHKRINIFQLHNWTAYLLLVTIVLHPVILLSSRTMNWHIVDITLPLWSPVQPITNTLGAIGAYVALVVIATSYFRRALGRHRWRTLHYLVYIAGACVFTHALLVDPKLKGNRFDPLDGEKFFVESCLFIICMAVLCGWNYRIRKDRRERAAGLGRHRVFAADKAGE